MTHERPILFSGPMVRAILEGRKTQTRRAVKPQHDFSPAMREPDYCARVNPYGQPGDHRLWVRETWATDGPGLLWWRADGEDQPKVGKWRPSIFMPRWASRITLEILSVRVERVQEISEADARAEGIERHTLSPLTYIDYSRPNSDWTPQMTAVGSYRTLWDSLNAKRGFGWDANPFVWVISFKKL